MNRVAYRFTLDEDRHKDMIDFLEDFPRTERGKVIINAIRAYMKRFPLSEIDTNGNGPLENDATAGGVDIERMFGGVRKMLTGGTINDPS